MRTQKTVKNIAIGMISQVINTLVPFISRTIFIYVLGATYLGINGVFTSILTSLSLAELGIASAITYSLYKPLSSKEYDTVNALMNLYAKTYRIIGTIIFVLGLLLTPFLDRIVKEGNNISNLKLIFFLILINSCISYFFSYKRTLFTADQKNYISTINITVFSFAQNVSQILLLLILRGRIPDNTLFLLYLTISIIYTFLSNYFISKQADKEYPFLENRKKKNLDSQLKFEIIENIKAMSLHKFGGVVVTATDNIFLSSFISVYSVALYSNYNMIIDVINFFLSHIFSALTSSIGNLNATEGEKKAYDIFNKVFFLCFWVFSFSSIAFLVLFKPFIVLWIGKDYLLPNTVVIIIIILFYLKGMGKPALIYRDTLGLFRLIKAKPVIEALINIVASLILIKKFGMSGVFFGTIVSFLTTSFWVEPYVVYRNRFKSASLAEYYYRYFIYTFFALIVGFITYKIADLVLATGIINFILRILIVIIIPNLLFSIIFFKTDQFKYFADQMKGVLKLVLHKK